MSPRSSRPHQPKRSSADVLCFLAEQYIAGQYLHKSSKGAFNHFESLQSHTDAKIRMQTKTHALKHMSRPQEHTPKVLNSSLPSKPGFTHFWGPSGPVPPLLVFPSSPTPDFDLPCNSEDGNSGWKLPSLLLPALLIPFLCKCVPFFVHEPRCFSGVVLLK